MTASTWRGPVSLRDGHERVHRIRCAVIAKRLDNRAPEKILAATHLNQQRVAHACVRSLGRQRPNERRPDELALFALKRLQQLGDYRRRRMVLVVHVSHRPKPVIGIVRNVVNELRCSSVVESSEQDERAEACELILVALDRTYQRGRHRLRSGPPQRARRVHPDGEFEIPERVDGRLNGCLRRRLWTSFLGRSRQAGWGPGREGLARPRERRPSRKSGRYVLTTSVSSFSAS